MCLIAFALRPASRWPLVIAANRDEFFERPALPLARWSTPAGLPIVSGRDVRAGGSWLGMTDSGRFAMLTNVRQSKALAGARSRGELVMRWLVGDMDAAGFMRQTDPDAYGGFNLVTGDFASGRWTWLSNRSFCPDSQGRISGRALADGWRFRALEPEIYGLSNAALDTPWPKTLALKAALAAALTDETGPDEALLWAALQNRAQAERRALPDSGVPLELEKRLSSAFVDDSAGIYGTRCSTLLFAEAELAPQATVWQVKVSEKTYQPGAGPASASTPTASELLHWQRQR
jgi:uncharacterized protein with NRDE domain